MDQSLLSWWLQSGNMSVPLLTQGGPRTKKVDDINTSFSQHLSVCDLTFNSCLWMEVRCQILSTELLATVLKCFHHSPTKNAGGSVSPVIVLESPPPPSLSSLCHFLQTATGKRRQRPGISLVVAVNLRLLQVLLPVFERMHS